MSRKEGHLLTGTRSIVTGRMHASIGVAMLAAMAIESPAIAMKNHTIKIDGRTGAMEATPYSRERRKAQWKDETRGRARK